MVITAFVTYLTTSSLGASERVCPEVQPSTQWDLNQKPLILIAKSDKYVAFPSLRIYYAWKNMKKSSKNNKFQIWAPMWKDKFELPNVSYSVSDIQDYFEYIRKHETLTDNPPIAIFVNKIENRITFKIKTGYWTPGCGWKFTMN